ncbi:MAG: MBL fold metallo-hydrolase [Candidatus Bathyarchaeota archaeon]|nr:MBL fold metallo-hydrolase [Candidatus Bathyarchaeota archaeon]
MSCLIKLGFNIFQLKVPLPRNPLRYLNSYLIVDDDDNLLIDTGIFSEKAFNSLRSELGKVGFNVKNIKKVLLTHFHADHVGLAGVVKVESNAEIMMSDLEYRLLKKFIMGFKENFQERVEFCVNNGLPEGLALKMLKLHPATKTVKAYNQFLMVDVPLTDGDRVKVGGRSFKVVWTPGHTPGHVCLYDEDNKLLFAGDHILLTITPNIALPDKGYEVYRPLKSYINSLVKIKNLNVKTVLPGHGKIFSNFKSRVEELILHHKQRCMEIVEKLKEKDLTAYEIASKITWNVKYPSWDKYPIMQKYFAFAETMSHLQFLKEKGVVEEVNRGGVIYYRLLNVNLNFRLKPSSFRLNCR